MIASNITPKRFSAVTPSDAATIERCIGIRIGVAGSVVVVGEDGVAVTVASVAVGETIPGVITKVLATGTTASSIVAFHI